MPKRVDANQKEIVKTLRSLGATVLILSDVGSGCPDICVGYRGRNFLVEIKDGSKPPSKQALTADEVKFHQGWKGHVCIINSIDTALRLLNQQGG